MGAMPTGALGTLLAVSQAIYLVTMLVLGTRLLLLARREGQLPELLLGLHFLLCCALGYVLLGGGLAAGESPGLLTPEGIAWLVGAGQLLSGIGVLAGAGFTWLVFRREVAWARALMLGLTGAIAVGFAGGLLGGGFTHAMGDPWYQLSYVAYMLAALWTTLEPLLHWSRMRRRLALGLAEPLVVNRFLLWAVGSALRLAMLVTGAISMADLSAGTVAALLPWAFSATAIFGVGMACAYWLTFFPPPAWARFVAARA
jgi:hypothetical protein